jgi:hypothetical protein
MNACFRASMALGFFLAIPQVALPALSAPANETGHKPAHHRVVAFAKARALVSRAPVLVPAAVLPRELEIHGPLWTPEPDGLSHNDEECVFGCIDH